MAILIHPETKVAVAWLTLLIRQNVRVTRRILKHIVCNVDICYVLTVFLMMDTKTMRFQQLKKQQRLRKESFMIFSKDLKNLKKNYKGRF